MSLSGPEWNLDKLFGRESQGKKLQKLAEEGAGVSIVILHGRAGSGKTSLIRSQPWKEKGWLLATGKFEESRTSEPFSAVIDALNELVDMWVIQNNASDVCRMEGFRQLLQEDVEFLRNILPKAFQVASHCTSHGKTTTQGTKTIRSSSFDAMGHHHSSGAVDCVNASFVRILKFLSSSQPVVLFLDDIHWADSSSLDVLKLLATVGGIEGVLLAVSYRDEEVDENHPVAAAIKEIKNTDGSKVHSLHVADLDCESVNQLVSYLTNHDLEETRRLSEVVYEKTAGNPFFIVQFLQMLRNMEFFHYSFSTYKWEWGDEENLKSGALVSDNVADVVAATMMSLDDATRTALKVASCLGKVMPLDVLVEYFDLFFDQCQVGDTCCPALRQIKTTGLTEVLARAVNAGILIHPQGPDIFMWSHDKLQHVAYSLIPEDMRPSLHMKLGKLLWKMSQLNPDEDWMVFMAADQVKRYSNVKKDEVLGSDVANLCYEAAKLSLSKSALYPALDMLTVGVRHLSVEDRWKTNYKLCLRMFSLLAEVAIQLGKFDDSSAAVQEVEDNAVSLEDKFRVQIVMLKSVTSGKDRNYALGAEKCLQILKLYGEKMPSRLMPGQLFIENQKLKSRLPGNGLEGLLDFDDMTDTTSIKTCRLLTYLATFVALSGGDLNLVCFVAYRVLNISCSKGLCEESAGALGFVARYLISNNHLKDATEYAELGMRVIDKFPMKLGSLHAFVKAQITSSIYSAYQPLHNLLDQWLSAHHTALRIGETEKAGMAIIGYALCYLSVGLPIGPLKSDLELYEQEARQFKMPYSVQVLFNVFRQTLLNLGNAPTSPTVLSGAAMDQAEELSKLEGSARKMTKRDIDTCRLLLACVYNEWDDAVKLLDDLEPFLMGNDSFVTRVHLRISWMGLAAFALGRLTGKKKYRTMGKSILKDCKEKVKNGFVNAHPVYVMLEAEESPSKERYDHAIKTCARLGLIHFEAYMCERAGLYFLEQKDNEWGEFYLAQAFVLYDDWGALGKVNRMKVDHPELLQKSSIRETAASALKGRSRYSSEYVDQLKELSWSSFSTNKGSGSSLGSSSSRGFIIPTS